MRTTLEIEDHLFTEAKKLAATRKTTLTAIMEESLRVFLAESRRLPPKDSLNALPLNKSSHFVAGVNFDDSSKLLDSE